MRAGRFAAAILGALALAASYAQARDISDSSGRAVTIPDHVTRVFTAGPPASTLLYALAPQAMTGWLRMPRLVEKSYLLPSVRDLPELGRLTGRGNTVNLEALTASKPDFILDFGTINDTYKSLADRVQEQTRVPYVLIDGRFANTPAAIRLLAEALDVKARGDALARYAGETFAQVDAILAKVPAAQRPRVYLARGASGLETGARGSINTEIIERIGAVNVVEGLTDRAGLANASLEQVIAWAPDTIVSLELGFRERALADPAWRAVPAVAQKRIFVAPSLPFGFIDSPPSINRLIGLKWLLHAFYPKEAPGDVREEVRAFYKLFYQVDLNDADLDRLLQGS
jgi:iron complex transport system substrate-binding protein